MNETRPQAERLIEARAADALPAHVERTEALLAAMLVGAALRAGYTVSVWDGEAWPLTRSADRGAIFGAMASTDHDTLRFHAPDGALVGYATLIYGNGCDLFHDWSDNAAVNAIVEPLAFGVTA